MRDAFGELRSVVMSPPRRSGFMRICAMVAHAHAQEPGRVESQWRPYLEHHLDAWPWRRCVLQGRRSRILLTTLPAWLSTYVRVVDVSRCKLVPANFDALLSVPAMEHVRALKFGHNDLADVTALHHLDHAQNLRELDASNNRIRELHTLSMSPWAQALERLDLSDNPISMWSERTRWPALCELILDRACPPSLLDAILSRPESFPALEGLTARGEVLSPERAARLGELVALPTLRHVTLLFTEPAARRAFGRAAPGLRLL